MNVGEKFGLPVAGNKVDEQKQPEQKLNFGGVANLFGEQPQKKESDENQIIYLSPNNLVSFKNHPFALHTGKRKQDLVDSIKEHGILFPILVREKEQGYYEILAGHNRVEAGKEAGIEKIPCLVVKGITEEEAMLIVVESNLMQRSFFDMKESEKAAVLYYRHEAMKQKDSAKEILKEVENLLKMTECAESSEKADKTREKVGKEYDLSGRTISRYLRVYECIPALKELLDGEKIGIYAAVALSYLSITDQEVVAQKIKNGAVLSIKKAEELKAQSQQLTAEKIEEIISEKKGDAEKGKKETKVILSKEITQKYFEGKKAEEVIEIIEKALEIYFNEMRG